MRLDRRLARMLGFAGQYATLHRLGWAGFIEIVSPSPGVSLLNLDSWFNHLRRCAEDPEFWSKSGPNYRAYSEAIR
jgi:hypothetical protein